MELVYPAQEHKFDAIVFRAEHVNLGEVHIHGSGGLLQTLEHETYETWLDKVTQARSEGWRNTGWVPGSTFFAIENGRIIGTIQIRHELNEYLINIGGHIGYGVRPSERRKGYGTQMLALALIECRSLGIRRALVTCDKDNRASARTIEKNGGVFENEFIEENGNAVRRYWIEIG